MTALKVSCPACQKSLQIQQALPGRARCPACSGSFSIAANGATALLPALTRPPAGSSRLPILAAILGGGFFFTLLGIVLIVVCLLVSRTTPEPDGEEPATAGKSNKVGPLDPISFVKAAPKKSDGPVAFAVAGKPVGDAAGTDKPICNPADLRPKRPEVDAAIDKGVAYLKEGLNDQGQMQRDGNNGRVGAMALVGLTLLSCDVSATDPKVAGIVARVRKEAPSLTLTYDLGACIWFLDKLGDPADRELIRKMALRLIAGQGSGGGWDYNCRLLPEAEEMDLLRTLEDLRSPPLPVAVPGDRGDTAPKSPGQSGKPGDNIKNVPVVKYQPGGKLAATGREDNSLTQFAVLALWAAQKYGVPAQRSLAMVEGRFRQTQSDKGTWFYQGNQWPDSMTCAGLIGLAVGHGLAQPGAKGSAADRKELARDPHIEKGLAYLGTRLAEIDLTLSHQTQALQAKINKAKGEERSALQDEMKKLQLKNQNTKSRANSHGDYYFLWSLERVAVIYDLPTVGGVDWYNWGADFLIVLQQPDGSWRGNFAGAVDTCFALLFLKRVNVAQDLTKVLQNLGGARDPGAPADSPTRNAQLSQGEIKEEPNVAPGRVKTRTGYKTPAKSG
jgi:hypothetical protein